MPLSPAIYPPVARREWIRWPPSAMTSAHNPLRRLIQSNSATQTGSRFQRPRASHLELHHAPLGYGKSGPAWVAECCIRWESPGPGKRGVIDRLARKRHGPSALRPTLYDATRTGEDRTGLGRFGLIELTRPERPMMMPPPPDSQTDRQANKESNRRDHP